MEREITLREGREQGMRKAVQILRAQAMAPEAEGTRAALIAILVCHIEHFFPEGGVSDLSRDIRAVAKSREP